MLMNMCHAYKEQFLPFLKGKGVNVKGTSRSTGHGLTTYSEKSIGYRQIALS
jgi:hypothetical protein